MPIVDMKKVFLLGHRQERESIMDLLHRLGVVELVDLKNSSSWAEINVLLEPGQAAEAVTRCETQLGEVRYCLDFLQRYFPVRKSFVQQFTGAKLELSPNEYSEYISGTELASLYGACREAEENMTRIRNEETRCHDLLEALKPWAPFPLPLDQVKNSRRVCMVLAAIPLETYPALRESLTSVLAEIYLEEVSLVQDQAHCFFIYLVENADTVSSLLKEAAAAPVTFTDFTETASSSILSLEQKLSELDHERAGVLEQIERLLEYRPMLMAYFDYIDNERAKQEAVDNLACTQSSFLLEGWVPQPALAGLEKELSLQTTTAVLAARDPDKYEEVPILLDNRGPAEAYEAVTRLYSVPTRKEIDPTPLLAPFFFVFFGICLSDAGYGVILSLAALFLTRRLKLTGMGRQLVNLLFLGGLSSLVFGVLLGGYFGDLIKLPALWFNPLDDPMRMLVFCFAIGLFQIYFGMGVQAYRSIKAGKPLHALFDQGIWFVFLNGLILLFFPETAVIGKWLAVGGVAGLILTQGRSQKGLLKKFLGGLVSLYNVTGYLSDVLSYSRLLALGLATGVIASAINTMGGLLAGGIGTVIMILVLFGGHMFNLVISTLGSYVHTSRLQYIEFFGKFFEGGGKSFRPFGITNKFVAVSKSKAAAMQVENGITGPVI
ncbi:MAG: V-type ATP synthase subunit I [Bacillota bacterium]